MEIIKFSHNWNKKLCTDCFSTIRLYTTKFIAGRKYLIVLSEKGKESPVCEAEALEVRPFWSDQLTEGMARLDTGYNREEALNILRQMYGGRIEHQSLCWILLKSTIRYSYLTEVLERLPLCAQVPNL
ncbi:ASCH domain-containing protein [Rapidithrix thailandica]|uniref:ASCH domain-containing protein n=1 Tax=Rapidithrix thailandica TaxID=413964 RepID=A0AAW9RVZ4_9BACT